MTETKFTPATWHTTADGYNVKNETDIMICVNSFEDCDEQCKANANLISAAPDLFEALVDMLVEFGGDLDNETELKARKALAKARGEL